LSDVLKLQQKILVFAKQEFLRHGYKDASLRNIASASGVTTGAIYTYFKDKNALFEAIVSPVCRQVEVIFEEMSQSYYNEDTVLSDITVQKSLEDLLVVYQFIYDHFEIFRLLVVGAEGSSRSNFVHTIVEYEVKHTMAYLKRVKGAKHLNVHINYTALHMIAEGFINAIFEPVRHNMSHEEALENVKFLIIFYTGGWQNVFKEICY